MTAVIAAARLAGFEPGMRLAATGKPVRQRPKIGDVVAIPASPSGHFHALIVARNGFGTAFGLVHGRRAEATLPGLDDVADPYPVYSDEELIRAGTWRVVGHATELLGRFPAEPEIALASTRDGREGLSLAVPAKRVHGGSRPRLSPDSSGPAPPPG